MTIPPAFVYVVAITATFIVSIVVGVRGLAAFKPFESIITYDALGRRHRQDRLTVLAPTGLIGVAVAGGAYGLFAQTLDVAFLRYMVFWALFVLGAQILMISLAKQKKLEGRETQSKPFDLSGR